MCSFTTPFSLLGMGLGKSRLFNHQKTYFLLNPIYTLASKPYFSDLFSLLPNNQLEIYRFYLVQLNNYTNEIKAGTPTVCAVKSVLTVTANN